MATTMKMYMVIVMLFVVTSQQRYIVRVYNAHTLHDMQILQPPQQRSDHIQGSEGPATAENNHADRMANRHNGHPGTKGGAYVVRHLSWSESRQKDRTSNARSYANQCRWSVLLPLGQLLQYIEPTLLQYIVGQSSFRPN